MSKFLLIENPGVAALESFTLRGASNKEGTDAIGKFGSGTKFGASALLRKGVFPVVTVGTLRIEYGLVDIAFQGAEHKQLVVTLKGKLEDGRQVNRTEKLTEVLNYGASDWGHLSLAVREYVSNALDAANGDASQIRIEIVDTIRAASGKTRVFIPLTDEDSDANTEILEVFNNLAKWFLHFDASKVWRTSSIIEKDGLSKPRIYRRGVFVREITHAEPSLFDYNLNDLSLDEARVASDYSVKWDAATFFRKKATPDQIAKLLVADIRTWETSFDLTGQFESPSEDETKERKARWQTAQAKVIGDAQVLLHPLATSEHAIGKGYQPVVIAPQVYEACVLNGLRTTETILTQDEREGRRIDEVTHPRVEDAVREVWSKLESIGATNGEKYPDVFSYEELGTTAGKTVFGFYRDNGIYINTRSVGGDVITPELFGTILEELAHYITKARDCSRDFQNWLIVVVTKLLR